MKTYIYTLILIILLSDCILASDGWRVFGPGIVVKNKYSAPPFCKWHKLTIGYNIISVPNNLTSCANASFNTWSACGYFNFSSGNDIQIYSVTGENDWYGYGPFTTNSTGEITSAQIYLNNGTCGGIPLIWTDGTENVDGRGSNDYLDVQNCITHELGHSLGLAHHATGWGEPTMAERSLCPDFNTTLKRRSLEADDWESLYFLYHNLYVNTEYSSITEALNCAPSGSSITVVPGSHSVYSSITLNTGVSMNIQSGSTISLSSGCIFYVNGILNINSGCTFNFSGTSGKFSINGQLTATGTTFQSSGGSWFGVAFYNSNSINSLTSCNFVNSTWGIYSENSSFIVLNGCSFSNSSGSYEAIGLNNTVIQAYGCKIGNGSTNLTTGINANNSSNVLVRNSKFYYASSGCVFGDNNTSLSLGSSSWAGNNSFMNSNYHINTLWNISNDRTPAVGNYWAVGPLVNPLKVDCSNPLSSDPNPYLSRKRLPLSENQPNMLIEKSSFSQSSLEDDYSLSEANTLFNNEKYSEALKIYERIIDKNADKSISKHAIIGVERCLEALGKEKEILTKYENLRAAKNNNWDNLIEFRKLKYTQDKISVNEKANILEKIIADNDDESLVKLSLSELIRMNHKNPVTASVYLDRLGKLYPNDLITRVNRYELSSGESEKYPEKPEQKSKKEINFEAELSNYPNPFNPSTTINYSSPKDGYVTIKVYDAIGREVKTLINENRPAGSYSANFNAANLSSGIYFYRLTLQPSDGTKSIVVNKSMQVVK